MTIITRLATPLAGSDIASLPRLSWASGLNPNRRWVPSTLPAESASITSWADSIGAVALTNTTTPADVPTVAVEAGTKYAAFNGVSNRLTKATLSLATMHTVLVIGRPNTGDVYAGASTGPICHTGSVQVLHGVGADVASITSGAATLAAVRDKWHMYAFSLPDTGDGTFVVDGNSTTFAPGTRTLDQLNLARSGSNYRQLRVLEVVTSADVFTSAQLIAAYNSAKAWYPNLAWA